jgi:hypothetical protein
MIPLPSSYNGTFPIPNGTDTVNVTGLTLPAVPRMVRSWVMKPAGGLELWTTFVIGSLTTAGFTVDLNGVTDANTYILGFLIFF